MLTSQSTLPFKWVVDGILKMCMGESRNSGDVTKPFENVDEEAPEDLETELPVQFSYFLSYMETSHEEAVATYFSQFEKQVAKEMLERPKVRHLLKTLGLEVFVPTNWTGVNGLDDTPRMAPRIAPSPCCATP